MLETFRHEVDDLFQRFFGPSEEAAGEVVEWAPRVDVEESDKEVVVKADLPGVDPKEVDVSVTDGSLLVRGEKKEEKEKKEKHYHRVERFVGQFYRRIPLPEGVETDKISAKCANGVVTVTIPKKPGAEPKKIPVKAG
jgi:HSP20 family protein